MALLQQLPGPNWTDEEIRTGGNTCLHPNAISGLIAFNRKEYFYAHEELEIAWRAEKGPVRDVYRGILQVGLAYYHILRGNYIGAIKMFMRCKPWLAPFPATYCGINVEKLRQNVEEAESALVSLGVSNMNSFNHLLMKPVDYT